MGSLLLGEQAELDVGFNYEGCQPENLHSFLVGEGWREVAHLGWGDEGVGELSVLESEVGVEGIEDDQIQGNLFNSGLWFFLEENLELAVLDVVFCDEVANRSTIWGALEGGEEGGNLQPLEVLPFLLELIGEDSWVLAAEGVISSTS